jgi:hypothetical protein
MNFRSNDVWLNGIRSNGVLVKWPFSQMFFGQMAFRQPAFRSKVRSVKKNGEMNQNPGYEEFFDRIVLRSKGSSTVSSSPG